MNHIIIKDRVFLRTSVLGENRVFLVILKKMTKRWRPRKRSELVYTKLRFARFRWVRAQSGSQSGAFNLPTIVTRPSSIITFSVLRMDQLRVFHRSSLGIPEPDIRRTIPAHSIRFVEICLTQTKTSTQTTHWFQPKQI